jgi:hypothetical protein
MARYIYEHDVSEILRAARVWFDRAMVEDGSVLSDEMLWTPLNIGELVTHYVTQPDLSSDSFYDKLERQLKPAPPSER